MPGPGRSQVGRTISSSPNGAGLTNLSELAEIGALINHCLNPSFEQILSGTHTAAIQNLAVLSSILNIETPGWRIQTDTGSPNITVIQSSSAGNGSDNGLDVQLSNAGTGLFCRVEQSWGGSVSFLDDRVKALVGRFVTLSGDIDMPSSPTANAVRLFVEDVAAVATNFSPYHSGGSGFGRLQTTSLQIGSMVTELKFGISFENATPNYSVDNMCLMVTDVVLVDGVAYVNREKETILHGLDTAPLGSEDLLYTTPADTSVFQSDSGTMDTPWDVNSERPCWANTVRINHREFGANNTHTGVRTAGDSNNFHEGVSRDEEMSVYVLGIGSDGQLEVQSLNADPSGSDCGLTKKGWIGYL